MKKELHVIQSGEQRASSTDRWLACVGSAIICGGEISSTDEYAAEGSAAHELLEYCLRFEASAIDDVGNYMEVVDGEDSFIVEVTNEMAEAVDFAANWVRENLGEDFKAEKSMDGGAIGLPRWTGHVDVSHYDVRTRTLTVVDFKYGAGVAVRAFENKQLLSYAAMTMPHVGPVDSVAIVVIQPRRMNPGESDPADVWLTDFGRIVEHIQAVSETSRTISWLEDNPEQVAARLSPGDHCQFCPAILKCPAIVEPMQEVALTGFDDEGFLLSLSADEVSFWFSNKKRVNKWMKTLDKRARQLADEGRLPGYKLVEAKGHRQWRDIPAAKAAIEAAGIDPNELVIVTPDAMPSPAQAEKINRPDGLKLKDLKTVVNRHTFKPPTGFTIVAESDPRKSSLIDAASEFDDEDEE